MDKLRLMTAIFMGKMILWLTKIAGSQGTVLPGKVARQIYPDILKTLGKNIAEEIIVVTGTNGKTTTSNMIAQILIEHGYSMVHNAAGANMMTGITTAFLTSTNLQGTKIFDYALLEVDEANVPLLIQEITPKVVLITNFFRDQLDRFGEVDNAVNLVKNCLQDTGIELVLNADDPLVTHFQKETGLHCWYFGFDDTDYDKFIDSENKEGKHCVFCGHELAYYRYHYAQLGKFYCKNCNNQNPTANFLGKNLALTPFISFDVNDIHLTSPYQGFYNAYNILAAVAIAKLVGLEDAPIIQAIYKYQPRDGRMEKFNINGKRVVLILVKNPTGLNQALSVLANDLVDKNILFVLNDNAADGRDVSWIWEADLEVIADKDYKVKEIVCAGKRSEDMAARIIYTSFFTEHIHIMPAIETAIKKIVSTASEVCYVLSTYTALQECRQILIKMEKQNTVLESKPEPRKSES